MILTFAFNSHGKFYFLDYQTTITPPRPHLVVDIFMYFKELFIKVITHEYFGLGNYTAEVKYEVRALWIGNVGYSWFS